MSAESDAQQFLKTVWAPDSDGAPIKLPVDPFVIAQRVGIKAYAADLDKGISGLLIKRAGEDPQIYVQEADSPNRRRFTCAHELGHYYQKSLTKAAATDDTLWEYVDHRDLFSSEGKNPDEIYANQFAASLLMPRDEVVRLKREGLALPALAYTFGVSEDAMRYRLDNLRLN